MKIDINKAHKITDGKKTTGVSIAYMLFQGLMLAKPGLISPATENVIEYGLGSGLFVTLGHKIWKNRKIIWEYTKRPIQWLKKGVKKAR